jgi:hypothetical protein
MRGEDAVAASSCDPYLGTSTRAVRDLPLGVDYFAKPWHPLKVLITAEQALAPELSR